MKVEIDEYCHKVLCVVVSKSVFLPAAKDVLVATVPFSSNKS